MRRNPLIQLILIHFREFVREPVIIFWSIIFPIAMAWVLGIAFSKQSELVQQVVLIENSQEQYLPFREFLNDSREITKEILDKTTECYEKTMVSDKLGKTTFRFISTDWDHGILLLKRGQVNLIMKEFPDSLEYFFDPINPQAKTIFIMLSSAINNQNLVYESAAISPLTQKGNRYIDFLIPGPLALGAMTPLLWATRHTVR